MISGTLEGRADDIADIYADGDFLKTFSSPFSTSTFTLPNNTRLLAVRGTNTVCCLRGFIIRLSNGFDTNTHWKCSNLEHDNWNKLNYTDNDWQPAITHGWPPHWIPHGLDPAELIWTDTYTDDVVYCRGWPSEYYASQTLLVLCSLHEVFLNISN